MTSAHEPLWLQVVCLFMGIVAIVAFGAIAYGFGAS
jgi:hypothetical protein